MPRSFQVPSFYKSLGLVQIKNRRREEDPKRKDLSPSVLDCGAVRFKIARHFGFCFGVENAIDIAYRALEQNPGRRIFLLSEMIHNPEVNSDLLSRGVRFLMQPDGTRVVDFATLDKNDIVIVPAFGTTIELQQELLERGIDPYFFDATCPFVQKVWKRADELGKAGYTVLVHGKRTHEETRATFSHSKQTAPTLVILNMSEAESVRDFILGKLDETEFRRIFALSMSDGFRPAEHLQRVGVVNQTTMLASETQAIAETIRQAMLERFGPERLSEHYADTRDTLCYATYENQSATEALIASGADLALVVGGYNSSNTSHLVELAQERVPTYYIQNAGEILSRDLIEHFSLEAQRVVQSEDWLPWKQFVATGKPIEIAITSGASCPDRVVEEVVERVLGFFDITRSLEELTA